MKNIWILLDDLLQRKKGPPGGVTPPPVSVTVELKQPEPDYDAAAELDRLKTLQSEYFEISDLIENEIKALQAEKKNPNTSETRRDAIARRILVLYNKRAGNTAKLQGIERKIEQIYKNR